jgi:hypothetical protein
MIGATKILGAEAYATNITGNNYVPTVQVTSGQRAKLFKVVVSNISASTDLYLWVLDTTTGSGSSAGPRMVMLCPGGVCSTLDLSAGSPFPSGIYLVLATAAPTDATTTPTAAANNIGIISASYRIE